MTHNVIYENGIPSKYHITYLQYVDGQFEKVIATDDKFEESPITVTVPRDVNEHELIDNWSGTYFDNEMNDYLHQLVGYALTTSAIVGVIEENDPKRGLKEQTIWDTGIDPVFPYEQDRVAAIYHTAQAIRHALYRDDWEGHKRFKNDRWKGKLTTIS